MKATYNKPTMRVERVDLEVALVTVKLPKTTYVRCIGSSKGSFEIGRDRLEQIRKSTAAFVPT